MKPKIKLLTCPSGDYKVLLLDGQVIGEGHSISDSDWDNLIRYAFDCYVQTVEITDNEMETGRYEEFA